MTPTLHPASLHPATLHPASLHPATLHPAPRRALPRTLGAVLLVLGAALGPLPAASAADVPTRSASQCSAGRMCLWAGAGYTSTFVQTSVSVDQALGGAAQSAWNRTSRAVRVYSGSSWSGSSTCFAPGQQTGATSLLAGSVRVLSTTTC